MALVLGTAAVAGEVKSGLEKGASPDAFNVNDVTGPAAGTSLCYRCRYGGRPVTAVFTRTLSDDLASLVKEVDSVVDKNSAKQAAAFVVLLTNDPDGDAAKIKEFAKKHGIKNVPLTTFDGAAGPPSYNIAKDAEVTVSLWNKSKVEANHAYGKGGLNKDGIAQIVADAEKMLK
jgi:hypothetical protein